MSRVLLASVLPFTLSEVAVGERTTATVVVSPSAVEEQLAVRAATPAGPRRPPSPSRRRRPARRPS